MQGRLTGLQFVLKSMKGNGNMSKFYKETIRRLGGDDPGIISDLLKKIGSEEKIEETEFKEDKTSVKIEEPRITGGDLGKMAKNAENVINFRS